MLEAATDAVDPDGGRGGDASGAVRVTPRAACQNAAPFPPPCATRSDHARPQPAPQGPAVRHCGPRDPRLHVRSCGLRGARGRSQVAADRDRVAAAAAQCRVEGDRRAEASGRRRRPAARADGRAARDAEGPRGTTRRRAGEAARAAARGAEPAARRDAGRSRRGRQRRGSARRHAARVRLHRARPRRRRRGARHGLRDGRQAVGLALRRV